MGRPRASLSRLRALGEKRADLGALVTQPGLALQLDGSQANLWTFAGGRIGQTLKYGLDVLRGWKVAPDSLDIRIEGDGVSFDAVREALREVATPDFWAAESTRQAVLARLPAYRLTKFEDCLPERFALETIEKYLLDIGGTQAWLASRFGVEPKQ